MSFVLSKHPQCTDRSTARYTRTPPFRFHGTWRCDGAGSTRDGMEAPSRDPPGAHNKTSQSTSPKATTQLSTWPSAPSSQACKNPLPTRSKFPHHLPPSPPPRSDSSSLPPQISLPLPLSREIHRLRPRHLAGGAGASRGQRRPGRSQPWGRRAPAAAATAACRSR